MVLLHWFGKVAIEKSEPDSEHRTEQNTNSALTSTLADCTGTAGKITAGRERHTQNTIQPWRPQHLTQYTLDKNCFQIPLSKYTPTVHPFAPPLQYLTLLQIQN